MKELRPEIFNPGLCSDCPVKDLFCRGMRKKIAYSHSGDKIGAEYVVCDEIIPEEEINKSVMIVVGDCEPLPVENTTPPKIF